MRATVVLTLHRSCQELSWIVQRTLRYKIGATRAGPARKLRLETIAMTNLRAPLFVLSHMRSYSSLLSHVLGSHPDIDGYCETHLRYRFPLDVLRLHWKVKRLTGEPLRGRFVLDKILHNYAMSRAILENPRTRAVFLLREPTEVVQSIIHMGRIWIRRSATPTSSRWWGYYEARLLRLAELAPVLGHRAAFLESSALIESTDEALEFLRDYLDLSQPLERRYRSFAKTGEPGFGDPSPAIRSGEIRAPSHRREEVPVPDSLIQRVKAAHAQCLEVCQIHCVPMSGGPRAARSN